MGNEGVIPVAPFPISHFSYLKDLTSKNMIRKDEVEEES